MWRRKAPERPALPTADAADLAQARQAREEVERAIESGRSRWPLIHRTREILEEIRRENHLAEDLHMIFSYHQRG